jgi:hypothetical protein
MNREIAAQSAVHQLFWALIDAVPAFLSFALVSATLVLGSDSNVLGINLIHTLSTAGGKAASTNYSDEATVGDIVGISTAPIAGVTLKSGFIGQLYEARSLAVSALPAAVVESGTTQLSAVATMDDNSLVRLGGSDAKWAVQDGPLAVITLSGLATAGEVFINAPATVRARWDDISGDLTLTVLNANATKPDGEFQGPSFLAQIFQPSMAGLYHGLLKDVGGQVVGAITGFTLKSTRTFTSKVIFNGLTYTLVGAVLADGSFSGEIKRTGKTSLLVTLQLGSTPSGGLTLQGTVSGDATTGGGFIAYSPFTTTNPVPTALVKSYTFLVPATATGNALLPEGDGFGSAKLSALGVITATGTTGDGVAFTAGGFLTKDRQWHLFQPLYSSKGQIAGVLTFRDVPNVSDLDGSLHWVKNPNAANKSYPAGFSVAPALVGAIYTPPPTGQRALSQLANQPYNTRLTLAGSMLPAGGLTKTLSWLSTNALAYYGPETLTGTTTTSTGILIGSYSDPATKLTVPFAGAVLQKQGLAGGNFLVNNKAGYLFIEPGTAFEYPSSADAGLLLPLLLPVSPATAPMLSQVNLSAAAAGSYGGILNHDSGLSGGLESVVLTSTGALSGTVVIEGKRFAFKGALGSDGLAIIVITRTGLPNIFGSIQLALATGTIDGFQLTGAFTADGTTHAIDAQRFPVYTTAAPAPQRGKYTLAMHAPDGVDAALQPGGDGYATLTVSPTGDCTGILTLADGTTATFSGRVSRKGEWSLHRSLYGTTGGFVAGKFTFRDVPDISDMDGTLRWVKPNAVPGTKSYVAGFNVTRGVVGSRYTPPLAGQRAFSTLANRFYNAWLRLSGPDMSSMAALEMLSMDRAVTWSTTNTILYYGPDKITLTFTPATGLITGTCVDATKGVNLTFGAALLPKQGLVAGYYGTGSRTGLLMMRPK